MCNVKCCLALPYFCTGYPPPCQVVRPPKPDDVRGFQCVCKFLKTQMRTLYNIYIYIHVYIYTLIYIYTHLNYSIYTF